ncbi:hypothetical protein EJB05_12369, partial [Eragrostis curvula]
MGSPRVRALSVTHVRPARISNPHDADHAIKLSLFDILCLPYALSQRVFFYEGDGLPPYPALVATLRSSLAATLAVFTPLAGKLAATPSGSDLFIDCSPGAVSEGVRFVEAEYAGGADDLRRLAADAEHDADAFRQLAPAPALEAGALPAPVLAVQVTRPAGGADGGAAIGAVVVGLSMSHVVADGEGMWQFIGAWAAAARGRGGSLLAGPTFDRAAINRHPKAEEVARAFLRILAPALPTVTRYPAPDITLQRQKTYLLTAGQIQSLKERISQQSNAFAKGEPPTPSTYAAVVSLAWTSVVRAKNAMNHADDDDAYLMFAADCRTRLHPPLPPGALFFGNCVKTCYARATVGELRCGGDAALARAAAAVRDAVREQLADPLADAERWLERRRAIPPDRGILSVSSHRFAAYDTDFGWGRPSRVEIAAPLVREFMAVVGAPDGGVQVSVALDREHMDGFEASFLAQLQSSA